MAVDPPKTRALSRIGLAAVIASFVLIWGYVMWLSFVEGRPEPRDRLDDQALTAELEAVCAPYAAELEELPFAGSMQTPADRSDLLDEATDILEEMVRDMRGVRSAEEPAEATAVAAWLDDWTQYNLDRRAYADRFRSGDDEPFRVTDRGGFHIDTLLDDFAKVNYMESCMTPDDV